MDYQIRQIEKYYLTEKDPKNLYKNIEKMTPAELKEIVNNKHIIKKIIFIINIVQAELHPRKKDPRAIVGGDKVQKSLEGPGLLQRRVPAHKAFARASLGLLGDDKGHHAREELRAVPRRQSHKKRLGRQRIRIRPQRQRHDEAV